MNQAEHTKLVESEKRRRVIVGVDRITARRFFTEASISDVAAKTGYAPYFEKSVVYMFILLGPLALLGAVAGSIWHFWWWRIIAAIVFPILYFYYSRLSRLGGARAYMVSFALASVLAFHFANLLAFPTLTQILVLFAFAVWCQRMLYVAATVFYRNMALHDAKLYELLADGIVLRPVSGTE